MPSRLMDAKRLTKPRPVTRLLFWLSNTNWLLARRFLFILNLNYHESFIFLRNIADSLSAD